MEKKILPVLGMACAGCSANVERRLKAMDGMKSVAVSLPGRTAMVEYDESKVTPADMKKVVDAAGFELIIDEETRVDTIEKNSYRLAAEAHGCVVGVGVADDGCLDGMAGGGRT